MISQIDFSSTQRSTQKMRRAKNSSRGEASSRARDWRRGRNNLHKSY